MNEILYAPSVRKARVEIIPLIDVIFFLLATFVLFTLSLNRINSLRAEMPPAGEPTENETLFIQASDSGTFYWKLGTSGVAETISDVELPSRLAAYKRTSLKPIVVVRGDLQAKFGSAVLILDQVKKAGIEQVSVETLTSPTGR